MNYFLDTLFDPALWRLMVRPLRAPRRYRRRVIMYQAWQEWQDERIEGYGYLIHRPVQWSEGYANGYSRRAIEADGKG